MQFSAFERYGKDFEAISALIGTKTVNEVKYLYNKYAKRIEEVIFFRWVTFFK